MLQKTVKTLNSKELCGIGECIRLNGAGHIV